MRVSAKSNWVTHSSDVYCTASVYASTGGEESQNASSKHNRRDSSEYIL